MTCKIIACHFGKEVGYVAQNYKGEYYIDHDRSKARIFSKREYELPFFNRQFEYCYDFFRGFRVKVEDATDKEFRHWRDKVCQPTARSATQEAQAKSFIRYMITCMGRSLAAKTEKTSNAWIETADTNFRRSTNPSYMRNAVYTADEIRFIKLVNDAWQTIHETKFSSELREQ